MKPGSLKQFHTITEDKDLQVLVYCDHIFSRSHIIPWEKRYLNHVLLPEISKVKNYLFSISERITTTCTTFSCLITRLEKLIRGLWLTYINYLSLQDLFLAKMEAIFPLLVTSPSHDERLFCELTFVSTSKAKSPPYWLNLHFLMSVFTWAGTSLILPHPLFDSSQTKTNVPWISF